MPAPTPIAKLYPQFQAHINALCAASASQFAATTLTGQRQWQLPPTCVTDAIRGSSCWDGDPWSWVYMMNVWTRDEMNANYMSVINKKGRSGEAMVIKLQMDYLATMERAFRTRHSSSVRSRIHAAARRNGHGSSAGPLKGTMIGWLSRLLTAAFDDPLGEGLAT